MNGLEPPSPSTYNHTISALQSPCTYRSSLHRILHVHHKHPSKSLLYPYCPFEPLWTTEKRRPGWCARVPLDSSHTLSQTHIQRPQQFPTCKPVEKCLHSHLAALYPPEQNKCATSRLLRERAISGQRYERPVGSSWYPPKSVPNTRLFSTACSP